MYRAQLGVLVDDKGEKLFVEIAQPEFSCCTEKQLDLLRKVSGWDIEPNTLYKISDVYLFIDHAANYEATDAVTGHIHASNVPCLIMRSLEEQIHLNTGIYSYSYNCIPADLLYIRWIVE